MINVTISFGDSINLFGHGGYSVNDHNHLSCLLYEYANLMMEVSIMEEKLQIVELVVWGNARDGFDVNQSFYTDRYIDCERAFSSVRKLFRDLRNLGYIIPKGSYIEYQGGGIEVYARNGMPLLYLQESA